MRIRTSLFAFMALIPATLFAETSSVAQPSDEEIALGWRFSDCAYFYLFSYEANKSSGNAKLSDLLKQLQKTSYAAAVALVGEEKFLAEISTKRDEFLEKFDAAAKQEGPNALQAIDDQCMTLIKTSFKIAGPKIQALADKKQAEKSK